MAECGLDRECESTAFGGVMSLPPSSRGSEIGSNFPNSTAATIDDLDLRYLGYIEHMRQIEAMPIQLIKSILAILYSIGVFANILLLIYIAKSRRYRSPTFAVIFALAICDMGTCFAAIFLTNLALYKLLGPPWLCRFCVYFTVLFYFSSIAHLVLFSIMRFYQLVHPLKARSRITVGLVIRVSAVLWVATAAITGITPTFIGWSSFEYKGRMVFFCSRSPSLAHPLVETVYSLVPNILIAGFHIAKYCVVKKQSERSMSEGDGDQNRYSTDARAVTIVIVIFCVTSWPHLAHVYVHDVFHVPRESFHTLMSSVGNTLQYGNSGVNPFIYALCAGSVRRDIVAMFRCKSKYTTTRGARF